MSLQDLILSVVSETTGIALADLTPGTSITEEAIGTEREQALYSRLITELHLGYLDAMSLASNTVGGLIEATRDLVPVFFHAGNKPDSVAVEGHVYRWHPLERAPSAEPESLRTVLEDGPWKWDVQSRFAGKGINPGHYFGLNVEAASAEMTYYSGRARVPDDYVLLTLDVKVDDVLDLTKNDIAIRWFLQCFDGGQQLNPAEIVSQLIATGRGGNEVTDYIGYRAHRDGYQGILFLGARAILELDRWNVENARPDDQELNNDYEVIRRLRRNRDHFNLVVFSGARLVGATTVFRCDGPKRMLRGRKRGSPIANPYVGWDENRILALSLEFGHEYQEQRRRGWCNQKPSIVVK